MRRWSYALGGLIAWSAHFAAVYACVSLAAQTAAEDTAAWQGATVAVSLVCAGACGILLTMAGRRLRSRPRNGLVLIGLARCIAMVLMDQLAAVGAGIGLVAIAWQAVAVLA